MQRTRIINNNPIKGYINLKFVKDRIIVLAINIINNYNFNDQYI